MKQVPLKDARVSRDAANFVIHDFEPHETTFYTIA